MGQPNHGHFGCPCIGDGTPYKPSYGETPSREKVCFYACAAVFALVPFLVSGDDFVGLIRKHYGCGSEAPSCICSFLNSVCLNMNIFHGESSSTSLVLPLYVKL